MIHAGSVDIKLESPTQHVDTPSDLKLHTSIEEHTKIDLILKLDGSCISTGAIYFKTDTLCSIPIHVNMTDMETHYSLSNFLDLMSLVNRSTSPGEFLSVFTTNNISSSNTSLLDIFIHLPSPHIDNELSNWCKNKDILDFLFQDIQVQVPGMKTTLYTYQKHSLWKILQRELAPLTTEKYQVIPLISVDNTFYYFDQLTGEISLSTDYIPDVKGGIICEDMGTGKTCICLATIMATKDLSNPFMNDLYENIKTDLPLVKHNSLQSLKSICTEKVLLEGINWKPIKYQLPFDIIELFQKYPMYYEWTDIPANYYFERSRRIQPNFTTLTVYLSNATLVVVPDNLVAQWSGEIYKHIFDGQLKFLVYDDDLKQNILPPIQLADYDLVLISQNRFSQENTKGGLDFKSHTCQCPIIHSTKQERACVCSLSSKDTTYISPLLQVHWKRLIVDEGHRLSSKNRQSQLSSKLFSNWKWICTGTPTQNLTESASMRTRQESESDDLNRLGTLFGQALNLEPFKSNKKLWHRIISKPFLDRKPWAITKLSNIMERAMIRNRRDDIEKEVTLPPLYQKIIYLDFDYYQWLAHNCQIAMISLNAILSKREGADYLFSPKNFKSLRETVHNLWQSCLWHSVDLENSQKALENCIEACTHVEQGRSDYGVENRDLWRIKDVLEHALNDKMFTCMMTQHSPSYVVQGLPNLFKEAWGWLKGDHGVYYNASSSLLPWDDHCVVAADKIIDAMSIVLATRDEFTNLFVYNGSDHSLKSVQEYQQAKKQQLTQRKKKNSNSDKSLPGTTPNEKEEEEEKKETNDQLTFYTRNAFSDAKVLSSSSEKINYLVNQIYRFQATEKCIIFSQHYNEMYEIYLALQLAKIRVLMYQDSRMNNAKRSQMILTFNTSDNANVIIMAVQKAAYGIDLSSATRVFFVSPVWQTAMEQQAIKRAHRIGQTKPVHIETLVIKNTIEHRLLERRDQVGSSESGQLEDEDKENLKRGDFFTDSKLKNILNHAYFVPLPETITKDEETGSYRQKIVPLDAPLYFIPPLKKSAEVIDEEEQQQPNVIVEKEQEKEDYIEQPKVLFTDDHGSDIDVDEDEADSISSLPPQLPTNDTLAISESKRKNSSSSSEDDMMLDIVGDEDVMDAIQPWKMRLLQADKKKRKRESSSSPPQPKSSIVIEKPIATEEEEPPKNKRPKKSVRFA